MGKLGYLLSFSTNLKTIPEGKSVHVNTDTEKPCQVHGDETVTQTWPLPLMTPRLVEDSAASVSSYGVWTEANGDHRRRGPRGKTIRSERKEVRGRLP